MDEIAGVKEARSYFFGMFGGPQKFDCWLTATADILADVDSPQLKPISLDDQVVPPMMQQLMHQPHEVIDILMDYLEQINAWDYAVRRNGNVSQAIDVLSGHVIEEGDEVELRHKYGVHNDD